ncbi:hypothetical protein VF11_15705 [Nostoc linckia z14]|nr:hypothetical protein VF11_15705 [Nostoc linckia z14]
MVDYWKAEYAFKTFKLTKVVIFSNPDDSYSFTITGEVSVQLLVMTLLKLLFVHEYLSVHFPPMR